MFRKYDFFILAAVMISFITSAWFWFSGFKSEGIFTAIWVPSILAFGIYFKLTVVLRKLIRQ